MHFYYHIILTEQIQEFISIAFLLIFDTIIVIGETLNITLRIGEIICQKLFYYFYRSLTIFSAYLDLYQ